MDKIQENETSAGVEHKETTTEAGHTPKEAVAEAAAQGQGVSGDENLSVWETARKFKMATFVCFMVTFSAAADGYSIGYAHSNRETTSTCSSITTNHILFLGLLATSSPTRASSSSLVPKPTPRANYTSRRPCSAASMPSCQLGRSSV
jgi:hypothetical protein